MSGRPGSTRKLRGWFHRHVPLDLQAAVVTAVVAGIASIAVGGLSGAKGFDLALILVVGVGVTVVIFVPLVFASAQFVTEFLRVAILDARLLSGIAWHPDLTLTRVEIPDRIEEGSMGQAIALELLYKPLLGSQHDPITGTVFLALDPPVVEFEAQPFDFSEGVQRLEFPVSPRPFAPLVMMRTRLQNLDCTVQLTIRSNWYLKLFKEPTDRSVTLDIGRTRAEPIDVARWTKRMIDNRYLQALPNYGDANPVIPSPSDDLLGTNLAIDSHRWIRAIEEDEEESNARLLLEVAARMVAHELTMLQPTTFVDVLPARKPEHRPVVSALSDVNAPALVSRLQEACDACLDGQPVEPAPAKSRQTVLLLVQDLSKVLPQPQADITFSLVGFESLPERRCLVTIRPSGAPPPLETRAVDLSTIIDDGGSRLMHRSGRENELGEAASGEPRKARKRKRVERHTQPTDQWPERSVESVATMLETVAAAVSRSGAVTRGLYVQPTPRLDRQWIDLTLVSEGLKPLTALVHELFAAVVTILATWLRSDSTTVYNVCNEETWTADRRLDTLRTWRPDDLAVVEAWFDGQRWHAVDPVGDAVVVSAVSNDWKTYELLAREVSRRSHAVAYVPLFGPMQDVAHRWHDDSRTIECLVLPLLTWDSCADSFVPSTHCDRYHAAWSLFGRLAAG